MARKLMILPAKDSKLVRLVRIPEDYDPHEVFRHVTGLIAQVEEENPNYQWADIEAALEDQGFDSVDFILGPSLD